MIFWFHSHYFIWNNSKSLYINATNQLTPCCSARHISINSPGGGAKNFYVAQKASNSKWCWHTLVPKNRHSLRKKNISRVGGRSNALPQFYVGGRVRIKVLSKRKLWVLWSVFRVTRKQSCCNTFRNFFLLYNKLFIKTFLPNVINFYLCIKSQIL